MQVKKTELADCRLFTASIFFNAKELGVANARAKPVGVGWVEAVLLWLSKRKKKAEMERREQSVLSNLYVLNYA